VDCTVSSFAARKLGAFWSNEYVPAYKCPTDHQYLLDQDYAPFGTTLISGVQVQGLGPVGVSITSESVTTGNYATGTQKGLGASSATNWNGPGASYKVILHCTSEQSRGWAYPSGPPT